VNAIWRVKDGKTSSKCEKKTTKSTTDGEQRADGASGRCKSWIQVSMNFSLGSGHFVSDRKKTAFGN